MGTGWQRLLGLGQIVVGGSLVYEGVRLLRGGSRVPGIAGGVGQLDETPAQATARAVGAIQRVQNHTVRNIHERVAYIRDRIRKDSATALAKEQVAAILSRKCGSNWCFPPKNAEAEIKALFDAIKDPAVESRLGRNDLAVRYTRDHARIDQFSSLRAMSRLKIEDCDGFVIKLGAWLLAVGYAPFLDVVQADGEQTYNHIYLDVIVNGRRVPLDPSVTTAYPGWEVDGAAEVLRNGRPSGRIQRALRIAV